MKTKRFMALGTAALMAVSLLSACGGKTTDQNTSPDTKTVESNEAATENKSPEKGAGQLSVYTSYGEDESQFMFAEFEKATGIKVKSVRLSAGEIFARVQAEGNNPQASVWYGTSTETLTLAGQDGYLEEYKSPEIESIPEQWRDPNNMWVPNTLAILCFINNTEWLEENGLEAPMSWDAVLGDVYKDNVVLAHPGTSGMSYSWLSTVVQHMGEDAGYDYMKALDKNIFQYAKSGAAPPRMVGMGECAVAFCWSSDAMNTKESGYPVSISYPAEGTGYELTGAAIIKNGPEEEAENAKAFIDWSLSKEAQELFVNNFYRLPVNGEAAIPDGLTKASDVNMLTLDAAWSTENRDRLINKFETEVRGQENLA